jgi:hypothetical protein
MSLLDVSALVGSVFVCWVLGFTAGYVLTMFKDAVNDVTRTG